MGHAEQNQQIKHQISRNVYLMYEVYKKSKEPLFGHFWPSNTHLSHVKMKFTQQMFLIYLVL